MMSNAPRSRLFLLRHAHSGLANPGQSDHDRILDQRGQKEASALGLDIAKADFAIDHVVCSTAARAAATFELVRPHLRHPFTEEFNSDLYASGVEAYLRIAQERATEGSVMLVGHNPMVEEFTMEMADRREAAADHALRRGFPPAGFAVIEFGTPLAEIRPRSGFLARLIVPASIA